MNQQNKEETLAKDLVSRKRRRFYQLKADLITTLRIAAKWPLNAMDKSLLQVKRNQIINEYLDLKRQYDIMIADPLFHYIEHDFDFTHQCYNTLLQFKSDELTVSNINTLYFVEITKFNGNVIDWPIFKDDFQNIVEGNKSFNTRDKFSLLKKVLEGRALELFEHMAASGRSYNEAWEILCAKGDKERFIFFNAIDPLLNQPDVKPQAVESIKKIVESTKNCLKIIRTLNVHHGTKPFITRILLGKLDKEGLLQFEDIAKSNPDIYSLENVLAFLEHLYWTRKVTTVKKNSGAATTTKQLSTNASSNTPQIFCTFCKKNNHSLTNCKRFAGEAVRERIRWVKQSQQCTICLSHKIFIKCHEENSKCSKCGKRHHILLHNANKDQPPIIPQIVREAVSNQQPTNEKIVRETVITVKPEEKYLREVFPTALLKLKSTDGSYHNFRALWGVGEASTIISKAAQEILKLPILKMVVADTLEQASDCMVNLYIRPNFECDTVHSVTALVEEGLDICLPVESFKTDMKVWNNYRLADPNFNVSSRIDLIIGDDLQRMISMPGKTLRELKKSDGETIDEITCSNSTLGWFMVGKFYTSSPQTVFENPSIVPRHLVRKS